MTSLPSEVLEHMSVLETILRHGLEDQQKGVRSDLMLDHWQHAFDEWQFLQRRLIKVTS